MPQEFQVLQCYSCKTFQVDIVKKQTKWSCKMCGEKQSLKKVFHRGIGKECRLYVQELNEKRIVSEKQIPSKAENHTFFVPVTQFESIHVDRDGRKWYDFMGNFENIKNKNFVDCEDQTRGLKRKLNSGGSKSDGKNVAKWANETEVKILGKDLQQTHRTFVEEKQIDCNELISIEKKGVKSVDFREFSEFTFKKKIEGEPRGSKWDEFDKGKNFLDNILIEENLNKVTNGSNKKYEKDRVAEVEQKIRNSIIPSNIFNFENNDDIDFILEI